MTTNTNRSTVKRSALILGVSAALAVVAPSAFAAVDVSAAVTSLTTDGVAAITSIGGAMLVLASVAVVFIWAKAAFF